MCIDILFSYVHLLNILLFCLEEEGKMKTKLYTHVVFFRRIWCCVEIFMVLVKFILNILFVKEPTLECGFWLIIEGYIVFLLDYLSLFISCCCLPTIYPNTTSPLIPIHVIILKYLVSNAKDT